MAHSQNQSEFVNSDIDIIKLKILNNESIYSVSSQEVEALKIYCRDRKNCSTLAETENFIEKLIFVTFEDKNCLLEGLKVLINLGTNEPMTRAKISELSSEPVNGILLKGFDLKDEIKFLVFRLIFIVTIDYEGCKCFKNKCFQVESVIQDVFRSLNSEVVDDSHMGRLVIDLLRYRYNLIKHDLTDHKECVIETLNYILRVIKIELSTIGLVGSSLNIFIGGGPNATEIGDLNTLEIEQYLKIMLDAYIEINDKDYIATTLMVALKVAENERARKHLRKTFLSNKNFEYLRAWKKMLQSSDTNISFLTGEFLLKLCKDRVARFNRHLGFECTAGYLYSKGLLKEAKRTNDEIEELGSSTDEEYFLNNPSEPVKHTPDFPENEEESNELEYLMKKISDFNERNK